MANINGVAQIPIASGGPGFVPGTNGGIFQETVSGIGGLVSNTLGSLNTALQNGIPRAIDGLLNREFGPDGIAGTGGTGDDRSERVAPADVAARSTIPFVENINGNTTFLLISAAALVATVVVLRR